MNENKETVMSKTHNLAFSIEFFPPKTEELKESFMQTARAAVDLDLDFISITYGAGGKTRAYTEEFAGWLKEKTSHVVMPHLTCVGHSREEIRAILERFQSAGYQAIMALRGDTPRGMDEFPVAENGFRYATELVNFIKENFPNFKIGVAGYPEKHPEASSMEEDITHLKKKVDAGGELVVTQLFFDNEDFFRFRDTCREAGITVPIRAGILPPVNLKQIVKFCGFCGARVPEKLKKLLEKADGEPLKELETGIQWTKNQVEDLIARDVDGIHFYALNKPEVIRRLKSEIQDLRGNPV